RTRLTADEDGALRARERLARAVRRAEELRLVLAEALREAHVLATVAAACCACALLRDLYEVDEHAATLEAGVALRIDEVAAALPLHADEQREELDLAGLELAVVDEHARRAAGRVRRKPWSQVETR